MTIARLGDNHFCPECCHGCSGCCHAVIGPSIKGSEDSYLNGRPILRADGVDNGIHCCCCGPNTWITDQGSPDSFINGHRIVRHLDQTISCGGIGWIISESSPDSNLNY